MDKHIITDKWLVENTTLRSRGTGRCAWTKAQLEVVGVDWPPLKGWKNRIIGKKISIEDALRFKNYANKYSSNKREYLCEYQQKKLDILVEILHTVKGLEIILKKFTEDFEVEK
jgi:hypothetical protein